MLTDMRTLLFILLLSAETSHLFAQRLPQPFRNDIGVFADIRLFSDFVRSNAQGIQLRHQRSQMFAWRLAAGHINYQEQLGSRYPQTAFKDTVVTRSILRNLEGAFIGGGVEVQRQFYKSVFLYAGADLRIGYCTANTDTQISYEYYGHSPLLPDTATYHTVYSFDKASKDGTGVIATATFLLGARVFAGKRFIIGTEFTNPVYYTNSKTGDEKSAISNLSLSLGQVMQRVYLSYRFR
jgi:hypothetical protein